MHRVNQPRPQPCVAVNMAVTEASNPITDDIDVCEPIGIARLLRQVDAQIFAGCRSHEGIYDGRTLATIEQVSQCVCEALRDPVHSAVVLSGCGTSGRLAFITARSFNSHLSTLGLPACYCYVIAGGDKALLKSVEATEDSWEAGVDALTQVTRGKRSVVFIGISCGLSAPFVAGQLDYCLQHSDVYTSVLLGFNPLEHARRTPIRNWDKTFHDVASEVMRNEGCYLLNPVVGPEAITGSTRMKGGTSTKMLLEIIFTQAHQRLQSSNISPLTDLLQAYELTYRHTYLQLVAIATAMRTAGQCLCSGGHIYYLGVGSVGIMSLIDASECPPTFGAGYHDVRGYIQGGYSTLHNNEGDLSDMGRDYHLSWDDFSRDVLPHITPRDYLVFVLRASDYPAVCDRVRETCEQTVCRTSCVVVGTSQERSKVDYTLVDNHVQVLLPWQPLSHYWSHDSHMTHLCEVAVKWVLNAISTGAHILRGKVLGNRMIDLQVSNTKLYHRSLGIIQDFSRVGRDVAISSLLSAIHDTDSPGVELLHADISHHIEIATGKEKVVPVALLVSTGSYTVEGAQEALRSNPIIRRVLAELRKTV